MSTSVNMMLNRNILVQLVSNGLYMILDTKTGIVCQPVQKKLPPCAAVGVTQLYFDETCQKQNQGIDTGAMASMNMGLGARCKPGSIKMFCLLPTYNKDVNSCPPC